VPRLVGSLLPYAAVSIQHAVATRTGPDGRAEELVVRPLRLASAQAEMAFRAAWFGALDTALELAGRALTYTRQCGTIVRRIGELEPVLAERWPSERSRLREFRLQLSHTRRALAWPDHEQA